MIVQIGKLLSVDFIEIIIVKDKKVVDIFVGIIIRRLIWDIMMVICVIDSDLEISVCLIGRI